MWLIEVVFDLVVFWCFYVVLWVSFLVVAGGALAFVSGDKSAFAEKSHGDEKK